MAVQVSIIIVSYNTKTLLYNCIKSIYEMTKDITFELIVSDNGSSDGSIEMLQTEYPEIIRIENKKNIGFGAANNRAAKIACGKYLLLLNSDTVLLNNAVKFFYDAAEKDIDTKVFGSWLFYDNGEVANSYGEFTRPFLSLFKKNIYDFYPFVLSMRLKEIQSKRKNCLSEINVDFVTGADLFIAKKNFDAIGGFDEGFFMYFEDDDLCRRILKKGGCCKILSSPQIVHLESKSSKVKLHKILLHDDSLIYYIRKWYNSMTYILFYAFFWLEYVFRLISPAFTIKDKIIMIKSNIKSFRTGAVREMK